MGRTAEGADAWAAGMFDGLRAAQDRDVAALTPLQRMEWLEEALRLAERTGALAAARRRKQRERGDWPA